MKNFASFFVFLMLLIPQNVFSAACETPPDCASLGYTFSPGDCSGQASVKCPSDPTKVWCNRLQPEGVAFGDILYSDMTTSPALVKGKMPIGIVYNPSARLALALDEKILVFMENDNACYSNPPTVSGVTDGKTLTKIIKEECGENTAAAYCYNYTTPGTEVGRWFLPSEGDYSSFRSGLRALSCYSGDIRSEMTEIRLLGHGDPLPNDCSLLIEHSPGGICNRNRKIDRCVPSAFLNYTYLWNQFNSTALKLQAMQYGKQKYWTSTMEKYRAYCVTEFWHPQQESSDNKNSVRCMIRY